MSAIQSIFTKHWIFERNKIGIISLETFWTMFRLSFVAPTHYFSLLSPSF